MFTHSCLNEVQKKETEYHFFDARFFFTDFPPPKSHKSSSSDSRYCGSC